MPVSRDNHYVPVWYQEGFLEPKASKFHYYDLSPKQHTASDGRIVPGRSRFDSHPTRCFKETDLYSTFFGKVVNDEIERRLFGEIDTKGAAAVRAFIGLDASARVEHFGDFFKYMDAQRLRTPRGLDWLRGRYPLLDQNDLMVEMQGIRMINCTIWAEGVREIVSAEKSGVKFVVTDHPVTIYNYALPPDTAHCLDPNDPSIALRGSQSLFPLNRDYCLIITNLEYAKDPATDPLRKRTGARNFRRSFVKADDLVRTRYLDDDGVAAVNLILKSRARRFLAAGQEEWLHPERMVRKTWGELRDVLLPPSDGLWHFGGELIASFDDGYVHRQDEHGRIDPRPDLLDKDPTRHGGHAAETCGCGSGVRFGSCCQSLAGHLRPSWTELSIRERNILFMNAVTNVLELSPSDDWTDLRRRVTDDRIATLYRLFANLWPRDTDLLDLLPKPDGRLRAVYTGMLHPATIGEFAMGASVYFGQLLIQHPFVLASTLNEQFDPGKNPASYRQEFVKSLGMFTQLMPLVERGIVCLFPDPCAFDEHLRGQMMSMANARTSDDRVELEDDPRALRIFEEEAKRSLLSMKLSLTDDELEKTTRDSGMNGAELKRGLVALAERDSFASLQTNQRDPEASPTSGRLTSMQMAPNFEITLYLAQATGAVVLTDSPFRWRELLRHADVVSLDTPAVLTEFASRMEENEIVFQRDATKIVAMADEPGPREFRAALGRAQKYLRRRTKGKRRPNVEAQIAATARRAIAAISGTGSTSASNVGRARLRCLVPGHGFRSNTVQRLLVMSSSEHHTSHVPMAFLIKGPLEGSWASPWTAARS